MPRTKRSDLPPVTIVIARTRRSEVRRTPNGGWAWKCALCGAYAEMMDAADHKLCSDHGRLDVTLLRARLIEQHRERTGAWPKHVSDWGRTCVNDDVLRKQMLDRLGIKL